MGHADDKGRLEANPAYLKAMIFKYDDDLDIAAVKELRDTCLNKMQSWPVNHPYRMLLYDNAGEEYIFFPNFNATNKPSHPTESQLPPPPPDKLPIFSGEKPEEHPSDAGDTPSQVRSGQSSQGKVRLGQSRGVQEDFTKFLGSEKDLTDFLTTTIEKYLPAGPLHAMEPIKKCWVQITREEIPQLVYELIWDTLKKNPPSEVARLCVKGAKYAPGKTNPLRYMQKILEDMEKKRNRSP
jgi:hypothetical protein